MIAYLTIAAIAFIILTLVDIHRGHCANKTDGAMGNLIMAAFWPATLLIVALSLAMVLICEVTGVEPPIKIKKS